MLVDEDLLRQMNCTSGMVIATAMNWLCQRAGQRIATVKSAPFAVAKPDLKGLVQMLRARGPLLQARPATDAFPWLWFIAILSAATVRALYLSRYYARNWSVSRIRTHSNT